MSQLKNIVFFWDCLFVFWDCLVVLFTWICLRFHGLGISSDFCEDVHLDSFSGILIWDFLVFSFLVLFVCCSCVICDVYLQKIIWDLCVSVFFVNGDVYVGCFNWYVFCMFHVFQCFFVVLFCVFFFLSWACCWSFTRLFVDFKVIKSLWVWLRYVEVISWVWVFNGIHDCVFLFDLSCDFYLFFLLSSFGFCLGLVFDFVFSLIVYWELFWIIFFALIFGVFIWSSCCVFSQLDFLCFLFLLVMFFLLCVFWVCVFSLQFSFGDVTLELFCRFIFG